MVVCPSDIHFVIMVVGQLDILFVLMVVCPSDIHFVNMVVGQLVILFVLMVVCPSDILFCNDGSVSIGAIAIIRQSDSPTVQ
jgi:hypothetical protein